MGKIQAFSTFALCYNSFMFTHSEIKRQFPILHRLVNDRPLIYFDNAASSQKPQVVLHAIRDYYKHSHANIHRGVHTLSQEATAAYENARIKLQRHFNAKHSYEIIFTSGTTESINLTAGGFSQLLKKDDEVLISQMEHHSNIVPWQLACEKSGATLRVIPMTTNGELQLEAYKKMLSEKTKIVAVNHVSNTLGSINPIKEIIDAAHKYQAAVLIDGAQAAPHLKVDVQALDCDFYSASSHKMYGPTGIGMLYGKAEWLQKLPPYQGGGEMIKEVTFEKTTFADIPFKFEAGTPNIAGAVGFGKAIDFINEIGLKNSIAYEEELLTYATKQLQKIPDLKIIGNAPQKVAVISFVVKDIHPSDIGNIVDKMGIAIRTGHHCTQPIMQFYNLPGTARISFAFYNSKEEIDIFIVALKKAIAMLK